MCSALYTEHGPKKSWDADGLAGHAGVGFPVDAMTCQAHIHLAAPSVELTASDIEAAVAAARPGIRSICCSLERLACAAAKPAAQHADDAPQASELSLAENSRSDGVSTAPDAGAQLNLFSNPLFSQVMPGQRL